MYQFGWFVVSDKAIVDATTNTLSLITTVDELAATRLPVTIPQIALTSLWWRKADAQVTSHLKVRYILERPGGEIEVLSEHEAMSSHPRQRMLLTIQGLIIKQAGEHYFVVEKLASGPGEPERWELVQRLPAQVTVTAAPATGV